jgi:hypothetical protein
MANSHCTAASSEHDCLALQMAMSLLQKAYPSDVITKLLPDSATSGPMHKCYWEASTSSDSQSELEADGSSISDSSDDCEILNVKRLPQPQWTQAMPYPAGAPNMVTPAEYYKSWIQEFWNPKKSRGPTSVDKQLNGSRQPLQQHDASSSSAGQCVSSSMHTADMPATPVLPDGGLAKGPCASQGQCAASARSGPVSCCGVEAAQHSGDLANAGQDDRPRSRRSGNSPEARLYASVPGGTIV